MKTLVISGLIATLLGAAPAVAANLIDAEGLRASPNSVTVGSVSTDKAGYVVVHTSDATGTKPGEIIGYAAVPEGSEGATVKVPLGTKVKAGAKLIVMLHEETDGDTKLGDEDAAVMDGAEPVQQVVTVE